MLPLKIQKTVFNILIKFRLIGRIFYINGPETLPAPLSNEEENRLLKEFESNKNIVREILIVHNLRLVVYIARKFDTTTASVEDLISIGTIGLIKAVNTFCPEKNIKLATYASRCIENEILMYLRKNSSRAGEISIDEPLNVDWDGNEELTQKEVADLLGISQSYISRLEKRIINKLKKQFEKVT